MDHTLLFSLDIYESKTAAKQEANTVRSPSKHTKVDFRGLCRKAEVEPECITR